MFGNSEEKREKKLKKLGRKASYAIGGGVALWLFQLLYPQHEGAEAIAKIFRQLSPVLILYGVTIFGFMIFKPKWLFKMNFLLVWFILPTYVLYLLAEAAG